MKPVAFAYERPTELADVLRILADNPDAKVIAGGQSLIPLMNFRLSRPSQLVDINHLQGLSFIEEQGGELHIGALVHHQTLHEDEQVKKHFPTLSEAAGEVGHWAIRTRGTLGGSLTHADPASELPAAMVALHALFVLRSADGERTVRADDFYLGLLTTDIQPNELLTEVRIPSSGPKTRYGFAEFARRPGDFALAGAYVTLLDDQSGEVTWFGVSGGPEQRKVTFSTDRDSRRATFAALAQTLDPLSEPAYRRRLAIESAEAAYQKAMGGKAQ